MESNLAGKVGLVILNWNGKADTLECLKTVGDVQVVVVDNASTDGSAEAISSTFPSVKVISNKENLGFADGNNVGISYLLSKGVSAVLILNNDTLLNPNTVSELSKTLFSDERIGIVGPKIYFKKDGGEVIWFAGGKIDWKNIYGYHIGVDEKDTGQYEKIEEVDFITGCCLMVRSEVFKKAGMFDGKYYLYYEDVDFCMRAKMGGFKVLYVPNAKIFHNNAASSGGPGSTLHQYYQTRNRYLFGFRYASLRTKLALLRECIGKLFSGKRVESDACRDFLLGKLGKGSYK